MSAPALAPAAHPTIDGGVTATLRLPEQLTAAQTPRLDRGAVAVAVGLLLLIVPAVLGGVLPAAVAPAIRAGRTSVAAALGSA